MSFNNEEKLSGFTELSLFLLEETSMWPFVVTDVNSAQINFNPYALDLSSMMDKDGIVIDVSQKKLPEGDLYQISITFKLFTRSELLEQLLEQHINKPAVVIGALNNESSKLYGTNLEPLYMTYEVLDGVKPEEVSFTEVKIKGETRQRPVYYTP